MKHKRSKRRRAPRLKHPETALSRRYLRIMQSWIPVGVENFAEWPDRPNSGHFFGGCHWYGQETIGPAFTFAMAASSPEFDEQRARCKRKELRAMSLKALRYLCFTHDTGPADCVRPKECPGRPENCSRKWGEKGRGFFPESQCGMAVAKLGIAAMLLGDTVDEETWAMIERVHADYASRWAPEWPRSGVYINTQMEENAWTAYGLAACALLLHEREEAAGWMRSSNRWNFYATTTPQDAKNHGAFDDTYSVAEKTHELINALPDYMAENHGMVHPSYTACPILFLGVMANTCSMHRQPFPREAFFNREIIYSHLRRMTDRTGSLHPAQGMDWPYLWTDPGCLTHATAAVLFKDPGAARLERRALETFEQRQASNGGRMYDQEIAANCHDIQDPIVMREIIVESAAHCYLFHRLHGDGPRPASDADFEKTERGVAIYPHSSFAFHRHRQGQTSFSWRNNIMALPLTRDGIQTIAPATGTMLGSVEVAGNPDSHDLVSHRLDQHEHAFASALVMDRAQRGIRQDVLFASLPSGSILFAETWTAHRSVTVNRVDQGFLRIINETFSAMNGNCNGYRRLYTPDRVDRFDGGTSADPDSDRVESYEHPAWLNIDGRIGIVFSGSGETIYHNRHYYPTWWAVADDLVLSRIDRRARVAAGRVFARFNALIVPGCSASKTATLDLVALRAPPQSAALIAEGFLAAANFADRTRTLSFSTSTAKSPEIPIFPGVTTVTLRRVTLRTRLHAGAATLTKARAVVNVEGGVEITATDTGPLAVRNTGQGPARVRRHAERRRHTIGAGRTITL